jgi:peptidoglycan hydrolase CwlO-like protein
MDELSKKIEELKSKSDDLRRAKDSKGKQLSRLSDTLSKRRELSAKLKAEIAREQKATTAAILDESATIAALEIEVARVQKLIEEKTSEQMRIDSNVSDIGTHGRPETSLFSFGDCRFDPLPLMYLH